MSMVAGIAGDIAMTVPGGPFREASTLVLAAVFEKCAAVPEEDWREKEELKLAQEQTTQFQEQNADLMKKKAGASQLERQIREGGDADLVRPHWRTSGRTSEPLA